ncbi:MAG: Flp pilus assembly protein CpaB [Deltaproteobacteria bacterium]|nr:Flp pilus assembly protein CpaB [Deltaproteobacteria bacterium]
MNTTTASASKFGALALGAIALACAGFAAYIASGMMSSRYAKTRVTPVVVAKSELKVGKPITAEQLTLVDFPEGAVPKGAFAEVDSLLKTFETVTPTVGILAGEPVVRSRLSDARQGTGVAALVDANMRAVALEVDASAANTGLVYPGAYVDVIVTFRDQDGSGPTAMTAVQRAQVLSVGLDVDVATRQRRDGDNLDSRRNTTYVTLEVTPEQAEIVGVARTEGRISLALRNGSDDKIVETEGARPLDILPELEFEEEEVDDSKSAKKSRRERKSFVGQRRRRARRVRLRAKAPEAPRRERSSGIEIIRR